MSHTLRIAVVGAGAQAQALHLPIIRRRWDRFELAALVDISPRRRQDAADLFGVPEEARYAAVADLLADVRSRKVQLDGVVVASDGLHVEDVLGFARRGIPVLVEPPLAFSEAQAQEVADFERMMGRRLIMLAYPQQHDPIFADLNEKLPARDLRLLDYEVRMPSQQALVGDANVTVSAYDLDSDLRAERREALEAAVTAGAGSASLQRDRDMWVNGLLTGMASQLAAIGAVYGPIERIEHVRQWPEGVIPGSIEVLGRIREDAAVRLVWHYLPFAPEYDETLTAITARRRARLEVAASTHLDSRSVMHLRERDGGVVSDVRSVSPSSAGEAMWEAFHAFIVGGGETPWSAADELAQVGILRQILDRIAEADGRSLEEPEIVEEPEAATVEQSGAAGAEPADSGAAASEVAASGSTEPAVPGAAEVGPIEAPHAAVATEDAWAPVPPEQGDHEAGSGDAPVEGGGASAAAPAADPAQEGPR